MIRFETTHGGFTVELFEKEAPLTVANFRQYVDEGFFDGTIFHRIVPGFVIQGGGLAPDFSQKLAETTLNPCQVANAGSVAIPLGLQTTRGDTSQITSAAPRQYSRM